MSPDPALPRPSQVTVAGWAVAVFSVIVVLAVFQTMGELNGLDMRERLTEALGSGSGKDLGLTVDEAISVLRAALYVAGVAAAAAAILGVYTLRRDRAARIGVSVAAVPIVLTALFLDALAFPAMFVGVGTVMLWTRPARDWFAGRAPQPRRAMPELPPLPPLPMPPSQDRAQDRTQDQAPPFAPPSGPPAAGPVPPAGPRPTTAWGAPAPHLAYPPPTSGRVPLASARPRQVRTVCLMTWILGGITGFGAALSLLVLLTAPDSVVDSAKDSAFWDSSIDEDQLIAWSTAVSAAALVLCVLAAVLAGFVWQRRRWAGPWLAGVFGVALLVGVFALPASLVHVITLVIALRLLLSVQSRAWLAGGEALFRQRGPRPPTG